uniref:vomeronasal type-2 receptor 26-like n=1 Tax=Euleptes europaea TaxID=460621 RepID=UPI00253F86B6|nr:vomeronasal type-2 receptor 26-like [Euleptes europaea]
MVTKLYQNILALVFAIQEINANPHLLPNATLGFHISDNYHSAKMTYHDIMDLLFRSHRSVPNYRCVRKKNCLAIIGGVDGESSFRMADILGLYKIPQLTYGSFALVERDATEVPQFYLMAPNEAIQYPAIIRLLLYFQWNWIGLLTVDDDSGENFLKTLEPLLLRNGICLASTGKIPKQPRWDTIQDLYGLVSKIYSPLTDNKANTVLFYGQSLTVVMVNAIVFLGHCTYNTNVLMGRMWIMTGQADITSSGLTRGLSSDFFQGALSFTVHSLEVPGFQKFLHNIKPNWREGNGFLVDFWEQAFNCSFKNSQEPMQDSGTCTGEEKLETIPGPLFEMHMTGHSYSIYNAVYAVAHALNAISTSSFNPGDIVRGKRIDPQDLQPWQLHPFLQDILFNNSAGETISFNKIKEMVGGYDITHLIIFQNTSFQRVKVGRVDADERKQFVILEDLIDWRNFNQVLPRSICNDYCYPGYHKQKKEGEKTCCYDCAPCPEGKISNKKDMVDCIRCPRDQFPSKDQDQCIKKSITFLSFEEPLGISSSVLAVSLSLITALMLGTFFKHRNTPIVKANNRNITYTLLASLLFCFLCPLLFLGEPSKATCLFRQVAFTIIFTVAVSSIMAKTITVVAAFMATKPGSSMRKWVGRRLAYSIIVSCSFIQGGICMMWLGTSPPFPDFDRQALTREIVAECNEGSAIMLYIALGYLGLLSVISLIAAFLARKLPDSFNEAKFITFSMLIFCSVWLSFFPAYLSTKGKYMVAMEIFSILASSAGLLACIFSPKCYIILVKPELNKKELLISRRG